MNKEQAAYDTALSQFKLAWQNFKEIEISVPDNGLTTLVNRVSEEKDGKKLRRLIQAYKNKKGLIALEANEATFDHQTQKLGTVTRDMWGKSTKTYELSFSENEISIKSGHNFTYLSHNSWMADLNLENALKPVDDMSKAEDLSKKTEALKTVVSWLQPQNK